MKSCRASRSDSNNALPVRMPIGLCSSIEFRVVPENAVLIERDTALRSEVGGDTRALGYATMECHDTWVLPFQACHGARKGVTQACHDLKQRQIGISQLRSDQMLPPRSIPFYHPLELTEIFL